MVRPAIRDSRQVAILEAAQSLIAEGGLEAVGMAALAAATGLSRPAIYQYFASREHVLAELVINEMADLSNVIDAKVADFPEPMEQVRIWLHYSLAHLASAEHRSIRQISVASLPEESRGMLRAMHGHFMTALISPLTELGVSDPVSTCHLLYASVAAAANRIDDGSDFTREASALERFAIAGIEGALSTRSE
ncbi:MAG: hypothetical protein RLZZ603_1423 [Actinomycetota bacterium]|jgi:AcrR family transcriptional regulator